MEAQISGLIIHFQSRIQFCPNVSLIARVEVGTAVTPPGALSFHDFETL